MIANPPLRAKRQKPYILPDCLRKKLEHDVECMVAYTTWRQSLLDAGEKEMQPLQSFWSISAFVAGFLAAKQSQPSEDLDSY
jgi:hypothetical protein